MDNDQSKMEAENSTNPNGKDNQNTLLSSSGRNVSNGATATLNGHAAIQRGLEVLAETDLDNNLEEIKKLDSQIDHFNSYLDRFEARNNELNKKLNTLLESQKEERTKRLATFQQKEIENRAESDALEGQMRALLNRCHQARRPVSEFAQQMEQMDQQDGQTDQDVADKH